MLRAVTISCESTIASSPPNLHLLQSLRNHHTRYELLPNSYKMHFHVSRASVERWQDCSGFAWYQLVSCKICNAAGVLKMQVLLVSPQFGMTRSILNFFSSFAPVRSNTSKRGRCTHLHILCISHMLQHLPSLVASNLSHRHSIWRGDW